MLPLLLSVRRRLHAPAGFHRVFVRWAKPFNPVLGETWQAALPDGTAIALEQISHHPPISAFQMHGPPCGGPGGAPSYTFTGHRQVACGAAKGKQLGSCPAACLPPTVCAAHSPL